MTDGVVSTPVGVIEPGRAIASGWGFLLTRPGMVLLWAAIGFVPALGLLWFLSDLYAERLTANGYLGFAPVALAVEAVGGFAPEAAPWPFGPTPDVLVAAAFAALVTALYHALCTRPLGVVWRMLVGTRRDRNFLAEVTG